MNTAENKQLEGYYVPEFQVWEIKIRKVVLQTSGGDIEDGGDSDNG